MTGVLRACFDILSKCQSRLAEISPVAALRIAGRPTKTTSSPGRSVDFVLNFSRTSLFTRFLLTAPPVALIEIARPQRLKSWSLEQTTAVNSLSERFLPRRKTRVICAEVVSRRSVGRPNSRLVPNVKQPPWRRKIKVSAGHGPLPVAGSKLCGLPWSPSGHGNHACVLV